MDVRSHKNNFFHDIFTAFNLIRRKNVAKLQKLSKIAKFTSGET